MTDTALNYINGGMQTFSVSSSILFWILLEHQNQSGVLILSNFLTVLTQLVGHGKNLNGHRMPNSYLL